MPDPSPRSIRSLAGSLCALAFAAAALPAPAAFAQHALAIQGGSYDGTDTLGLQWTLPAWFRSNPNGWRISGSPELQVNAHERGGDDLVQGGLFATFRFEPPARRVRPYLEAGIGVNYFNRNELGSKDFSTRVQFGELLGLGLAWGGESTSGRGETWLGLRFSHFSNAGIRSGNSFLDTLMLTVGHRF